jgi:hypothetical protein
LIVDTLIVDTVAALFVAGKVQQFRFPSELCKELNAHANMLHSQSKTEVLLSYISAQKKKALPNPPKDIHLEDSLQKVLTGFPENADVFCRFAGFLIKRSECKGCQNSPMFRKTCGTLNPVCKEIV